MPSRRNKSYPNGRLMIAAAGAGKTTYIVGKALEESKTLEPHKRILITTFTDKNEEGIKKKVTDEQHCIPTNIIVQTWFSFLLQHGVRPYQDILFPELHDKRVKGILPVNDLPPKKREKLHSTGEFKADKIRNIYHYFTKDLRIYTDKLSKFVCKTIEEEKKQKQRNFTLERLKGIFSKIYIDEMQDLAGYDLNFVELLIKEGIEVTLVGDPRQRTYLTNNGRKNKTKEDSRQSAMEFFKDKIKIDTTTLNGSFRNCQAICDFANRIHGNTYKPCKSKTEQSSGFDQKKYNEHHGIWIVNQGDVKHYIEAYSPKVLRYNKTTAVDPGISRDDIFNFGASKGLTFDRVLIYPTKDMEKWLKNSVGTFKESSNQTACKFYVAVTRARYSVAFVCSSLQQELFEEMYNVFDSTKINTQIKT